MTLSSKLLARIFLPLLALLVGIGALYRHENITRAEQLAQTRLERRVVLAGELVVFRMRQVDRALGDLLRRVEFEHWADTASAGARFAERRTLADVCQDVVERAPEFLAIELYDQTGDRIVSARVPGEDGGLLPPGDRLRLFGPDAEERRLVEWLPGGKVRLVRSASVGTAERRLGLSVVVDTAFVCSPAITFATRYDPGTCVLLVPGGTDEPRAPKHRCDTDADVMIASAGIREPPGQIELHLPSDTVLAGVQVFEIQAVTTFVIAMVALMVLLWRGLSSAVLAPAQGILSSVQAFDAGQPLPPPVTDGTDELGVLETSLRDTLAAYSDSRRHLQELNETLESRVDERTSQLARYSAELARTRDAARGALRERRTFLNNVSHEIRTPLNAVIGMSGLLLDGQLTGEQKEFAEAIRRSGHDLLELVDDILDFSRFEQRSVDLEEVDFELSALLADVVARNAVAASERGLALSWEMHPGLDRSLHGDAGRLHQVLHHLMDNGVKFTESGSVVLRALPSTEPGLVRFEVQDSGIGISSTDRDRLFQAFTQGDGSSTRRYGGTGLGLALCVLLVEALGGRIGVESQLGRGSLFWFSARLRQQRRPPALPPAGAHPPDGAGDTESTQDDEAHPAPGRPGPSSQLEKTLKGWPPKPDEATTTGAKMSHDPTQLPSPIDTSALDELRLIQEDGGPDIISELIEIFLDDVPQKLAGLDAALAEGDPAQVQQMGHALKGSSAQLGATHLSNLAHQMETAGREGRLDGAGALRVQLDEEFARVKAALNGIKTPPS